MKKYVTTYINENNSVQECSAVPERAVNYLKCLKVEINPSVGYEDAEHVETEFSYNGKALEVSLEDEYTKNPIWHLKNGENNIATFSERAMTFRGTKAKDQFDYRIIVSQFQNGLSIGLWSMVTGINSCVSVIQNLNGGINVKLICVGPIVSDGSHNTWEVNIHQPVGKQFYKPRYYLEQLRESIDVNKYFRCCDKNNNIKKDSEEIKQEIDLLTAIASDSEFEEVLKTLMGKAQQIDLPEGKTLGETGSVKIKTRVKKIGELI